MNIFIHFQIHPKFTWKPEYPLSSIPSFPFFKLNNFITIPSSYRVFLRLSIAAEFVPHWPHTHAQSHDEHADSRDGYQGDSNILRRRCVGRWDFRAERRPLDLVLLCRRLRDTGGGRIRITLGLLRLLRLQLRRFWYIGRQWRRLMRQRRPGVVGQAGQAQQRRPDSAGAVLTRKRAPGTKGKLEGEVRFKDSGNSGKWLQIGRMVREIWRVPKKKIGKIETGKNKELL